MSQQFFHQLDNEAYKISIPKFFSKENLKDTKFDAGLITLQKNKLAKMIGQFILFELYKAHELLRNIPNRRYLLIRTIIN